MSGDNERLRDAVHGMAVSLGQSEGAFSHLTCGEADSVVRVLAVAGLRDAAARLVVGHALGDGDGGDDDGDRHWPVVTATGAPADREESAHFDAALAYVDALVPPAPTPVSRVRRNVDPDHEIRPDDDPEPGDRCKECGRDITWLGPSPVTDWEHCDGDDL